MMALYQLLAGTVTGYIGLICSHNFRLRFDEVYKGWWEFDEQAQRLTPGMWLFISICNGFLNALVCWYFTFPTLPVTLALGCLMFLVPFIS